MWAVSTVTVKTPSTTLLSNVFINMSTDTHTHISCGRTLVLLCLQVKPQLRCSLLFYFSNNINGNNSVLHKTIFLCHLTSSLCGVYCTEVFMPLSCMCTLIHRGAFQSFFSNSTATTFSKLCGSAARTRSTHTHTLHCMTFKAKLTHEQTDLMRSRHPSKDKSKQGRTLPRLQRDPEPHLNCTPQSASPFIRAQSLASADLSARQRAASLMSSCLCVLLLLLQLITSRAADECRCPDLHKHLKSSLKSHFYGLAANAR